MNKIKAFDRENLLKEITFKAESHKILQERAVTNGTVAVSPESVTLIRDRVINNLANLPEEYRRLRYPQTYNVFLSPEAAQIKQCLLEAANFYRSETSAGKE